MFIAFWFVMLVTLILYLLSHNKKYKKIENTLPPLLFLAGSLIIVAIITKDPLFSSFGVPSEFEWVVGLFLTGLSSWKLYFSPLKERVITTEREVSSIKTSIEKIEKNVDLLAEKTLNGKVIANCINLGTF